jgi:very-short-patch-repair endonuclease
MWERQGHTPAQIARGRRLRRSMGYCEQKLWRELRKLNAHIRRQAPVGNYVADFACHAKKLVIEVDGEVHERLDEVALRDHERAEWLRGQGYTVVRFTNRQVEDDIDAVVDEVRKHLALPLDGEGLGWGVSAESKSQPQVALSPTRAIRPGSLPAPQSPALSPSRGKGAIEPGAAE